MKIRPDNPFFDPQLFGKARGKHSHIQPRRLQPKCRCTEKTGRICFGHTPRFCKLHRVWTCGGCGEHTSDTRAF